MNALHGPPTLETLQAQADAFGRRLDEAEARLKTLTEGVSPFRRTAGMAMRIQKAEDDVQAARQALLNAERVYLTARAVWDRDGP